MQTPIAKTSQISGGAGTGGGGGGGGTTATNIAPAKTS